MSHEVEVSLWRNNATVQFYPVQMATAEHGVQETIAAALPGLSNHHWCLLSLFADDLWW